MKFHITKNSNSSLFKQYFLLFLLITFVPVLISCISLYLSYKSFETEVISSNKASTQLIQQSLDSKMKELEKVAQIINEDPSLTSYALKNSSMNACNRLEHYTSLQSILTDIMIVPLKENNTIYSSDGICLQEDLKYQSFMNEFISSGYSCEEFYDTIYNASTLTYWPTNTITKTPKYLCRIVPFYTYFTNKYTVQSMILLINQDYIHNLFRSSQTTSKENILLLNNNFELLSYLTPQASTQAIIELCEYLQAHEKISDFIELDLDGKTYLIFSSYSTDSHLYYIRFLSKDIAYSSVNTLRTYILLILVLVFIVNILLIFYGMKRSYQPIHSLAEWLKNMHEPDIKTNNELTLFKQVFENTFEQKSILTSTLANSRQGLVDHFLTSLICGDFLTKESFLNACHNLNIPFNEKYYCACSLIMEESVNSDSDISFKVISETIQSTAQQGMFIQIKDLTLAKKIVIILNSNSADIEYYKTHLKKIQKILLEEFMLLTTIGIGSICDSYDKVRKSYLESTNALDYRFIYGKSCLITPDIIQSSTTENYPTQDLEYLNFTFLSKNPDLIIDTLQKIKNFTKSQNCNLHTAKYICNDIISLVMKLPYFADSGYTSKFSQKLNIIQLTNFETIDDFFVALHDLLENNLFEKKSTEAEPDSDIKEKLLDYIHTHCFSYDFQISKMAEDFNITPQYLRKIFKAKTEVGLSDYISQLKLEKAMELLKNSDLNLSDIVIEIGNTEISGFMRFFKKRTGLTPGQYRNLYKENSDTKT